MKVLTGVRRHVPLVTGLSCPRIQLFSLSRHGSRETHLPPRVRVRSFSETAVCYASKDGTTKDSGSDGGKVLLWGRLNLWCPTHFVHAKKIMFCMFCFLVHQHRKASVRGRDCPALVDQARVEVSSVALNVEIPAHM